MKTKLIQTQDYLLLIDEEAEINKKDWCINSQLTPDHKDYMKMFQYEDSFYVGTDKIIAYRKLNEEVKEFDLPLLPKPFKGGLKKSELNRMVIENFILYYTHQNKDEAIGISKDMYEHLNNYIEEDHVDGINGDEGQSKQFSLEDMKKCWEDAIDAVDKHVSKEINGEFQNTWYFEDFIKTLSPSQQLPKEFIPEYIGGREYLAGEVGGNEVWAEYPKELKTITNSEGKQELVGTYKY